MILVDYGAVYHILQQTVELAVSVSFQYSQVITAGLRDGISRRRVAWVA